DNQVLLFTNQTDPPGKGPTGMKTFFEGFDPGSERTLAAWIRHASRTNLSSCSNTVAGGSGERGSKAWVTYPGDGDSLSNERVIPGDLAGGHPLVRKRVSPREGLTWY